MARTKTKGSTPLVVGSISWGQDIPKWLVEEVSWERTMSGLAGLMGKGLPKVGDAEVCVYLMTASFEAPMSSEHCHIYQYVLTQVMVRKKKEIPEDIRKDELGEYEMGLLDELMRKIYTRRGGEARNPLLDAMRVLKKQVKMQQSDKVRNMNIKKEGM